MMIRLPYGRIHMSSMISTINIITTTMTSLFAGSCMNISITVILYNSSRNRTYIGSNNNHRTITSSFTNEYSIIAVDVIVCCLLLLLSLLPSRPQSSLASSCTFSTNKIGSTTDRSLSRQKMQRRIHNNMVRIGVR